MATTCGVIGCTHGSSGDGLSRNDQFKLCGFHKPYFEGIETPAKVDLIAECDCNRPMMYGFFKCSTCNPLSMECSEENLELMKKLAMDFHQAPITGKGQEKFCASDFMSTIGIMGKSGVDAKDILAGLKAHGIKFFEVLLKGQGTQARSRKPTKAQFISEVKDAATKIAIKKGVENLINGIPTLLHKLGVSHDQAAVVQEFLSMDLGRSLILGMLAGMTTYMPVPEKFEHIATMLAVNLRANAMETFGNGAIDTVSSFLPNLYTDFSKGVEDLASGTVQPIAQEQEQSVAVEVEQAVSVGVR